MRKREVPTPTRGRDHLFCRNYAPPLQYGKIKFGIMKIYCCLSSDCDGEVKASPFSSSNLSIDNFAGGNEGVWIAFPTFETDFKKLENSSCAKISLSTSLIRNKIEIIIMTMPAFDDIECILTEKQMRIQEVPTRGHIHGFM